MIELGEFTNERIASALKLRRSNISPILKKLSLHNLIYLHRKAGRHLYYRAMEDLNVLLGLEPEKKTIPRSRTSLGPEDREKKLLSHLKRNNPITTMEYMALIDCSRPTAIRDLGELVKKGTLRKAGDGRGTHYVRL